MVSVNGERRTVCSAQQPPSGLPLQGYRQSTRVERWERERQLQARALSCSRPMTIVLFCRYSHDTGHGCYRGLETTRVPTSGTV